MVALKDRITVNSTTYGYNAPGTIVGEPTDNGFWLVAMDDDDAYGSSNLRRFEESRFLTVETPKNGVEEDFVHEEEVRVSYAVEFTDGSDAVTFENVEHAGIYATGVVRGGGKAEVVEYVEKIVKSRRVIDSL